MKGKNYFIEISPAWRLAIIFENVHNKNYAFAKFEIDTLL